MHVRVGNTECFQVPSDSYFRCPPTFIALLSEYLLHMLEMWEKIPDILTIGIKHHLMRVKNSSKASFIMLCWKGKLTEFEIWKKFAEFSTTADKIFWNKVHILSKVSGNTRILIIKFMTWVDFRQFFQVRILPTPVRHYFDSLHSGPKYTQNTHKSCDAVETKAIGLRKVL